MLCSIFVEEKAAADEVTHGNYESGLLTVQRDPGVVLGFCSGHMVPVVDTVPEGGKAHYTACPTWRGRREADWAREAHTMEATKPSIVPFAGTELEGAIQPRTDTTFLGKGDGEVIADIIDPDGRVAA